MALSNGEWGECGGCEYLGYGLGGMKLGKEVPCVVQTQRGRSCGR